MCIRRSICIYHYTIWTSEHYLRVVRSLIRIFHIATRCKYTLSRYPQHRPSPNANQILQVPRWILFLSLFSSLFYPATTRIDILETYRDLAFTMPYPKTYKPSRKSKAVLIEPESPPKKQFVFSSYKEGLHC